MFELGDELELLSGKASMDGDCIMSDSKASQKTRILIKNNLQIVKDEALNVENVDGLTIVNMGNIDKTFILDSIL